MCGVITFFGDQFGFTARAPAIAFQSSIYLADMNVPVVAQAKGKLYICHMSRFLRWCFVLRLELQHTTSTPANGVKSPVYASTATATGSIRMISPFACSPPRATKPTESARSTSLLGSKRPFSPVPWATSWTVKHRSRCSSPKSPTLSAGRGSLHARVGFLPSRRSLLVRPSLVCHQQSGRGRFCCRTPHRRYGPARD